MAHPVDLAQILVKLDNLSKRKVNTLHCVFQVFIGFVLKQFEYIEVGQFR